MSCKTGDGPTRSFFFVKMILCHDEMWHWVKFIISTGKGKAFWEKSPLLIKCFQLFLIHRQECEILFVHVEKKLEITQGEKDSFGKHDSKMLEEKY